MECIETILQRNNNIDTAVEKHWKEESDLKQKETEAIHDMVEMMGGEVEVDVDNDDYPIITYDGGRHSEYNSTICACVTSVKSFEKRGFKLFSVDIDECEDYECDRITFADIDQIYNYICGKFEEFCDEQKNGDLDEIGAQD